MTQGILSDMSSDDVNSYTDTVESQQVASIIRDTYFHIISGRDWPQLYSLFRLTGASTFQPTRMGFPNNLMDVKWVKYNKADASGRDKYVEIPYREPKEFLEICEQRNSLADNVKDVQSSDGIALINVYTDRHPTMWTTFNENTVTFDAYDIASEPSAAMTAINTQCYGKLMPDITMSDSLIFPLPIEAFTLLEEEAKSTAFLVLKQMANEKAEQHAVTQRRRMSQQAWAWGDGIKITNMGRRGKK